MEQVDAMVPGFSIAYIRDALQRNWVPGYLDASVRQAVRELELRAQVARNGQPLPEPLSPWDEAMDELINLAPHRSPAELANALRQNWFPTNPGYSVSQAFMSLR